MRAGGINFARPPFGGPIMPFRDRPRIPILRFPPPRSRIEKRVDVGILPIVRRMRVVMIMAAKSAQLRPGRVARLLLRVVYDQPVATPRELVMPASGAKLPPLLRHDRTDARERDLLRA